MLHKTKKHLTNLCCIILTEVVFVGKLNSRICLLPSRGLGCGRFCFSSNIYEEGWRSKESTRLPQIHQCDPGLNPGVEAICGLIYCWFSLWLREDFLWVLRLFPFFKNQHFQITIQSGVHRHISMSSKLLSALWINKL